MAIGSNTIEFRRVQRRKPAVNGSYYWEYVTQINVRSTVISILGVSLGSWSGWQDLELDQLVVLDENGDPITP